MRLLIALLILAAIAALIALVSIRRASQHSRVMMSETDANDVWLAETCRRALKSNEEHRVSHSGEHTREH